MTSTDEGILTAVIFLGMMLGGWIWGSMADQPKYGRIKVLQYSLFINALFGVLSSVAFNFWMLLVIRFISGIGVGGSIPVTFSYASEFFDKDVRGKYLALVAVSWPIGAIFASLMAWLIVDDPFNTFENKWHIFGTNIQSWRIFLIPCAIPALIGSICFGFFSDNSPKFLIFNKASYYKASKLLIKIAKQNGTYDKICHIGGINDDTTQNDQDLNFDGAANIFDPTRLRQFAKQVLFCVVCKSLILHYFIFMFWMCLF